MTHTNLQPMPCSQNAEMKTKREMCHKTWQCASTSNTRPNPPRQRRSDWPGSVIRISKLFLPYLSLVVLSPRILNVQHLTWLTLAMTQLVKALRRVRMLRTRRQRLASPVSRLGLGSAGSSQELRMDHWRSLGPTVPPWAELVLPPRLPLEYNVFPPKM